MLYNLVQKALWHVGRVSVYAYQKSWVDIMGREDTGYLEHAYSADERITSVICDENIHHQHGVPVLPVMSRLFEK